MTGEFTPEQRLDQIVVVLQRPQDPVNVGAILRAMKNMGLRWLRLVQPEPLARATILRVAHHCEDLLDQMTSHATINEAVADLHFIVGTAALRHPGRAQTADLRQVAQQLTSYVPAHRVGLLFGPEDDGLDQAALDRCHLLVTIPTNPDYPALNLAQAVLLLLYEVRMAALTPERITQPPPPSADQAMLERLFTLSATTLATIDFFKGNQQVTMRKIRQIIYKAHLTPEEAALLIAMLRCIERLRDS